MVDNPWFWSSLRECIQDTVTGITDKIKMNEAAGWRSGRFLLYGDSKRFESLLEQCRKMQFFKIDSIPCFLFGDLRSFLI